MTRTKIIRILLIGLTLPLIACLDLKQPSNKIDYYSLEYDPPRMRGSYITPIKSSTAISHTRERLIPTTSGARTPQNLLPIF
jgi:hypothetical protein